ncbi:rod shape-determining protein [Candidatus Entotheonella palauensis]|uniref:rod shape-determining protein n=1 Tax=Candidatus Entotheonella palauensis TaxID=93172 RepID=UPI000B7F4C98|nr:rod shape-determining protein [Candidatus Entotheonella palauensis]
MVKYLTTDLAINLGTANTVVYTRRQGVVAHEPSVVAMQERLNGSRVALHVGQAAKAMIGRTSEQVSIVRPLHEGVVADCDLAHMMLQHCLEKAGSRKMKMLHSLRFVFGIPAQCTTIERRAVIEAARAAGARGVYLIYEPLAVALGEGLDIREPYGRMIVDIGGGTTNVSVISVGGLVYNKTLLQGGEAMDEAIIAALRRKYHLDIGIQTAEQLKIELGNVLPHCTPQRLQIEGTDVAAHTPCLQEVTSHDIRDALIDGIHTIIDAMREVMGQTPPELLADIAEGGVLLTGGASLLDGLDSYMREHLGVPVYRANNPMTNTAIGAAQALDDPALEAYLTTRP